MKNIQKTLDKNSPILPDEIEHTKIRMEGAESWLINYLIRQNVFLRDGHEVYGQTQLSDLLAHAPTNNQSLAIAIMTRIFKNLIEAAQDKNIEGFQQKIAEMLCKQPAENEIVSRNTSALYYLLVNDSSRPSLINWISSRQNDVTTCQAIASCVYAEIIKIPITQHLLSVRGNNPFFHALYLLGKIPAKNVSAETLKEILNDKGKLRAQLTAFIERYKGTSDFSQICDRDTVLGCLIDKKTDLVNIRHKPSSHRMQVIQAEIQAKNSIEQPIVGYPLGYETESATAEPLPTQSATAEPQKLPTNKETKTNDNDYESASESSVSESWVDGLPVMENPNVERKPPQGVSEDSFTAILEGLEEPIALESVQPPPPSYVQATANTTERTQPPSYETVQRKIQDEKNKPKETSTTVTNPPATTFPDEKAATTTAARQSEPLAELLSNPLLAEVVLRIAATNLVHIPLDDDLQTKLQACKAGLEGRQQGLYEQVIEQARTELNKQNLTTAASSTETAAAIDAATMQALRTRGIFAPNATQQSSKLFSAEQQAVQKEYVQLFLQMTNERLAALKRPAITTKDQDLSSQLKSCERTLLNRLTKQEYADFKKTVHTAWDIKQLNAMPNVPKTTMAIEEQLGLNAKEGHTHRLEPNL